MKRLTLVPLILLLSILSQAYTIYLPMVASAETHPLKGLARAYPGDLHGAGWWYVWGVDQAALHDIAYVPMSRCMEIPALPTGYAGWLMVGNEPNNPEPYGCPVSPAEAVVRVAAIRETYPQTRLVVGNVSAWAGDWLRDYQTAGGAADAWGIHGYTDISPSMLTWYWTRAHSLTGGDYWISEFAEVGGNVALADALVSWMEQRDWIDRWAWFTNRARGDEEWYPPGWQVQLEEWKTGALTPMGQWYQEVE